MTEKIIMENEELEKVTGGLSFSATPSATTPFCMGYKKYGMIFREILI
ncbi:MAG: hypothetical protein IJP84_11190 [Lachnospiraceae bacterium]|nr:hypothetical protein [Clostridia bacterium]MBQ6968451.1 hypothetical protein [Lachnospiraceae bacterium]